MSRSLTRMLLPICWYGGPAVEGAAAADWYGAQRPLFVEHCLNKNTGDIDRYRLCETFIQKSFAIDNFPDATIFLRQRLMDLIPNYQSAAEAAFFKFEVASYAVIIAGLAAVAAKAMNLQSTTLFGALGTAIVAFLATFGFNAQFKANFITFRELTTLRDQIELTLVEASRTPGAITQQKLDGWFAAYAASVNEHAKALGASFSNPKLPGS